MNSSNNQHILDKEIDLIQSCISRMAQNSFLVRKWFIALVSVSISLFANKVDIKIILPVYIWATVCFWYLDAFFLRLERLYRWKYEWVIAKRLSDNRFCYDLNPYNEDMWLPEGISRKKEKPGIVSVMFTITLCPLYLFSLLLLIYFLFIG